MPCYILSLNLEINFAQFWSYFGPQTCSPRKTKTSLKNIFFKICGKKGN